MISDTTSLKRPLISEIAENEKPKAKTVPKWKKTLAKVWNVVSKVLLGLANAVFFLTNPTLYPLAFLVGVVWNDTVAIVIDKITIIWKKQPWAMAIATGVAGFLSLQVAWATASCLFAAHLGATLSTKAQDMLKKEQAKKKKQDDNTFKLIE